MNAVENTCRTCGKISKQADGADLHPMYTSTEYRNELKMIQEEFDVWNLNISQGDGLPQKICLTCFDSFCQIHNFRKICQEAQMNFGELCTGLDIIIKLDSNFDGTEVDFPEDYEGEQTITVQEHYQFPGGQRSKNPDGDVGQEILCSNEADSGGFNEEMGGDNRSQGVVRVEIVGLPEIKEYQCEFCMDLTSFDDADLLNEHYNLYHASDTPYPCPKCDKSFDMKSKRNSHARIHYPDVMDCEICGKKVRGGQQMMAQHNELRHIYKDRNCTTCGKTFRNTTLKRFNYHLSWHNAAKLHKCKYCDKKFIQTTHLAAHERTHTGENHYLCSECGAGFKSSGMLSTHMKMHGLRDLACTECPKKFFHSNVLKSHMKTHDPNKYKQVPSFACESCGRPFRSSINLSLHKHKKHGEPATPAVLDILKTREIQRPFLRPYKCEKCPESFPTHKQLVKHIDNHDEKRPYTCDRCGKSFKRESHLKLHIDSLHLNKKPYKCTMCSFAFFQRINLREHIAVKHDDARNFKCNICGKAFGIARTLRTHMRGHEQQEKFTCTICSKSFRQLGILKWHMNSHSIKKARRGIETNVAAGGENVADVAAGVKNSVDVAAGEEIKVNVADGRENETDVDAGDYSDIIIDERYEV